MHLPVHADCKLSSSFCSGLPISFQAVERKWPSCYSLVKQVLKWDSVSGIEASGPESSCRSSFSCQSLDKSFDESVTITVLLQVLSADAEPPTGCPVSLIDETTTVYMQLGEGDVDHSKELDKHLKEKVSSCCKTAHYQSTSSSGCPDLL